MFREQKRALWAVPGLILLAVSALAGRRLLGPGAVVSASEELWRLRYEVAVKADRPARLRVLLPDDGGGIRIVRETFSRAGLAMDIQRGPETGTREAVLFASGGGRERNFAAEFDIRIDRAPAERLSREAALSPEDRERYLQPETDRHLARPAVNEVLAGLPPAAGPAERLRRIFEHCRTSVAGEERSGRPDAAGATATDSATEPARARAMGALCRVAGIPARLITGISLDRPGPLRPLVWLEAHVDGAWVPYEPARDRAAVLPAARVPLGPERTDVVRAPAGAAVEVRICSERLPGGAERTRPAALPAQIADLTRLAPGMQTTLSVLLLLPVGALITAVFRQGVGVSTYGTFTPALLALSFLYSDPVTGLVVFVLVLTIGLAVRALLDRLKLLLVPRLSVMLTVIVLCLAAAVSVLGHFGLTPSAGAVVLPVVIMTMLVERFYVCREEDGAGTAWRLLGGTVAVASCCLVILRWEGLGRTFLSYPELELLVVSALLLIGWYSGYRLTELVRFRDLALGRGPGET
jgi:hypothetical protein